MSSLEDIRKFPHRLRTALAFFEDPVLISDLDGKIVYCNPSFEKKFNISMDSNLGESLFKMVPKSISLQIQKSFEKLKSEKKAQRFTIANNGFYYLTTINPVFSDEKLSGVLLYFYEMSKDEESTSLSKDLLNTLLEELYETINQMTILFSRELGEVPDFKKLYEQTESLLKSSVNSLNNLADFSKAMLGELKLVKTHFQPVRLLKLAIRAFKEKAKEKGLFFEELSHQELPEVIGDETKLNRILVLLLDYFFKITPRGECLTISCSLLPSEEGYSLIYSICSTGIIQTEQHLLSFFGEFSKLYSKLSPEEKVLARNQAIARRLLLAMKGSARIGAHEDTGTSLSISVPVELAPQASEEE